MPALPLTAGGKTDREALRAQADPRTTPDDDEPRAAGSLPTVLRVSDAALDLPARPDTDIIDAGGHSLLVAIDDLTSPPHRGHAAEDTA